MDISATFDGNYDDDVVINTSFDKDKEESKIETHEHVHGSQNDKTLFLGGIEYARMRRVHPIFNVRYDYLNKAKTFYRSIKQNHSQ